MFKILLKYLYIVIVQVIKVWESFLPEAKAISWGGLRVSWLPGSQCLWCDQLMLVIITIWRKGRPGTAVVGLSGAQRDGNTVYGTECSF